MNRKLLIATIFSTAIFVIFLGMRNPYLNQNHGPKQRPRAILETTSPHSQQTCKDQGVDAEVSGPVIIVTSTTWVPLRFESTPALLSVTIPRLAARAPPSELSLNA